MKPMTLNEIRSLAERREMLEKKCRELQRLAAGRGASLLPLLRTKTGRYSERQTRALAAQLAALVPEIQVTPLARLTRLADRYSEEAWDPAMRTDPYAAEGVWDPAVMTVRTQPLARRELLEDLAYCALRFVERSPGLYDLRWNEDYDPDEALLSERDLKNGFGAKDCLPFPVMGGRWGFEGSFGDLLRVVREAFCFVYKKEGADILPDEAAMATGRPEVLIMDGDTPPVKARNDFCLAGDGFVPGNSPVFFRLLDEVYHRLRGHSILEDLSGELPELAGLLAGPRKTPAWEEEYEETLKADGYWPAEKETRRRFFGEGPRWHYAALGFSVTQPPETYPEPDLYYMECFHDPNLTTEFPNPEEFCQSYLRLHRACFEKETVPQHLWHAMEIAADTWLCRKGLSHCMEDDAFFTAYGYLEQAVLRCGGESGGGY